MSDRQISQTAKTLIEAKKLIEDEGNWCVGELRNKAGQMCALGAGCAAASNLNYRKIDALAALQRASEELHGMSVANANNTLGHAAVMEMFDLAIASELSKGAGE